MKHELTNKKDIEKALTMQPVFCTIPFLDKDKSFVVRDVRRYDGFIQVKVLEGWHEPKDVWIETELLP